MRARWIVLPLLALLAGCVFREAGEPRFFRPASTMLDASGGAPPPRAGKTVALRLKPVTATPFLRERIAWRSSAVEYGLYEQRRWSELPETYVQRALENALREKPDLRLSESLDVPTLHVEVVAFDEDFQPAHEAQVSLAVSLRDHDRDRSRLVEQTFSATSAIASDSAADAAIAMGRALDEAVGAVADAVAQALQTR